MTKPGQLRELIRLEKNECVEDEWGDVVCGWHEHATVPARIVGMKGTEAVVAGRLQGIQPWIISIRYTPDVADVNTTWRAIDARRGTEYNIRSIIIAERGDYADLLCESGVAT